MSILVCYFIDLFIRGNEIKLFLLPLTQGRGMCIIQDIMLHARGIKCNFPGVVLLQLLLFHCCGIGGGQHVVSHFKIFCKVLRVIKSYFIGYLGHIHFCLDQQMSSTL